MAFFLRGAMGKELGLLVIGIVAGVILWRAKAREGTQIIRPAEA